jgi:hypothetical protein
MHKSHTHIARSSFYVSASTHFSFLQFSRFPPKNNLLFPAYPPPLFTSNSSIIIICFLSLNLYGHAHRRPTSCRLSIIPPIPKRYRHERHFSFRRTARSHIDSGRGKSHCTRWMQTAENKLISPAQISSELKSSSSAVHSMTTTGKTNSKN